jgi:hypothetical protein
MTPIRGECVLVGSSVWCELSKHSVCIKFAWNTARESAATYHET